MSEIVWSVNILLGIGLLGVLWVLYYILTQDNRENVSLQNQKDQQNH
jgi:hypothetical protein